MTKHIAVFELNISTEQYEVCRRKRILQMKSEKYMIMAAGGLVVFVDIMNFI